MKQMQDVPRKNETPQDKPRRTYCRPEIIHELELETRAGSPLGIPDPMDPFGLDPNN